MAIEQYTESLTLREMECVLGDNGWGVYSKFSAIPLIQKKSITWYVEQLEMKIKPMMDYADSTPRFARPGLYGAIH